MVITIEPGKPFSLTVNIASMLLTEVALGIYVPPTANFPKHFHNIGIRIEVRTTTGSRSQHLILDAPVG